MFASCTTMATAAKNANLIYKIALLQFLIFTVRCKYTLTIINLSLNEIFNPIPFFPDNACHAMQ
jgi:hypothetical protein